MNKITSFIILSIFFVVTAFGQQQPQGVHYIKAQNYFANNQLPNKKLTFTKITTEEQFNKLFGMATVMGRNGKPTPVNFETQFVIAVITPKVSGKAKLFIENFTEQNHTLTLTYRITEAKNKSSFKIRIPLILILNKKSYFKDKIKIIEATKQEEVPYKIAKHYFVKNTVKKGLIKLPNISSKEEFQKYFGMAAIMGKDGKPTPIDFSKQFVIAVINHSTKNHPDIKVNNLTRKNGTITLNYHIDNNIHGNGFRTCIILIIEKKYKGKVKITN